MCAMADEDRQNGSLKNDVHLKKVLGVSSSIGMLTGLMIGSGIFVSPNEVVRYTGSSGMALIVWTLSGIMATIGALCYIELGTMIPKNGSNYTYLLEAFGEGPAFMSLWVGTFLIGPAGAAINALVFARYLLQPIFPDCSPPVTAVKMLAALVIALLGYINCTGVKTGNKMQAALSLMKILSLLTIVTGGIFHLSMGNLHNFQAPMHQTTLDSTSLATAFYSTWFAYSGWDALNFIAEEIKDPNRNMPLAIGISMTLVTVIYLLTNAAYFVVLSPVEMLSSDAVAVTFVQKILGAGSWIISIFVAISTCGSLNGSLVIGSRQILAAGRTQHLPFFMSFINIKKYTPITAVIFTTLPSLLMLSSADVGVLLTYSAFPANLITLGTGCALLWLRYKQPSRTRPFKVWTALPVLYLLLSLFVAAFPIVQKPVEIVVASVVIAGGLAVYFIFIHVQSKPKLLSVSIEKLTYVNQMMFECVPENTD